MNNARKDERIMRFKIKETGEVLELSLRKWQGDGWDEEPPCYLSELTENDDNIKYNSDEELYITDQKSFDWWENYVNEANIANKAETGFKVEILLNYGNELYQEIVDEYYSEISHCNLENESEIKLRTIEKFKEEYLPSRAFVL